jgi:hypothetical protein
VRNEGAWRISRQDVYFQDHKGFMCRILNEGADERNTVFRSISGFII